MSSVPRPRPRKKDQDPATDTAPNRGSRGTRGSAPETPDPPPPPPPPKAPPRAETRTPRKGSLESRLNEFLGAASIPFAVAGDNYSAQIVAARSPALAKSLAELANENAAVKRVLNRIMEGSAWGGVAIASLSIILPICQHHGLIPGTDPFSAIMPGPAPSGEGQSPRMRWSGGSTPTPDGSTMGAPGPGSGGDTPPNGRPSPDEYKTTVPGSPPGVVTVASTTADHAS